MDLSESINRSIRQSVYNKGPGNADVTHTLAAMGDATSCDVGLHSKEVQESSTLQKSKKWHAKDESSIQDMQQKIENAEKRIDNMRKFLYADKKSESALIEKLNITSEMVTTITNHINYITNMVEICQEHKDHLSNIYHSVISQQREEVDKLQKCEEMTRRSIFDLQIEYLSLKDDSDGLWVCYNNKLQDKHADLESARAEYKRAWNKLETLVEEKETLMLRFFDSKSCSFDLKNDYLTYAKKVKDMKIKLVEVSADLEFVKNENLQTNNDAENLGFEMISNGLESTTVQLEEELAGISSMKCTGHEPEENLTHDAEEQKTDELQHEQIIKFHGDTRVASQELRPPVLEKMRYRESEDQRQWQSLRHRAPLMRQRLRLFPQ